MSKSINTQPCPDFYTAGGTLDPSASSYIVRSADNELLEAVKKGQFCYILTPRQMGKSSLMVRTAESLQKFDTSSVIIDLSASGTQSTTIESWYLGQVLTIAEQLEISGDYVDWWQQNTHLSVVQRFVRFLTHDLLKKTTKPIVIFIDEIDTTISLPFNSDDYFAAIRALYNQRARKPMLKQLTFVLLGVASPSDLIKDAARTPFNVGTRIHLTDFTSDEAKPLACGLAPDSNFARQILDQILLFTGGHPYFTQKTCMHVAKWAQSQWSESEAGIIVEKIVQNMFLSELGRNTDDNLKFVSKRILESDIVNNLLPYYKRICEKELVRDNELDPIPVALKLSGIVKANDAGILIIRNLIYQRVFDKRWVKEALSEREPEAPKDAQFLYDVFISYSRRDSEWARHYLLPYLDAAGLRVWSDIEIIPGERWEASIERAIEQSRNMLVVLSPDSVASQLVLREIEAFFSFSRNNNVQEHRRIIPLLLRRTEVPLYLQSYQWIDFTESTRRDTAMGALLSALDAPKKVKFPSNNGIVESWRKLSPTLVSTPPIRYNTAAIRNLLTSAFDDNELTGFVYDYFLPFFKQGFVQDATKNEKIQQLIEYVDEHALFDQLLDAIAAQKPLHYDKFRGQLEIREIS